MNKQHNQREQLQTGEGKPQKNLSRTNINEILQRKPISRTDQVRVEYISLEKRGSKTPNIECWAL